MDEVEQVLVVMRVEVCLEANHMLPSRLEKEDNGKREKGQSALGWLAVALPSLRAVESVCAPQAKSMQEEISPLLDFGSQTQTDLDPLLKLTQLSLSWT